MASAHSTGQTVCWRSDRPQQCLHVRDPQQKRQPPGETTTSPARLPTGFPLLVHISRPRTRSIAKVPTVPAQDRERTKHAGPQRKRLLLPVVVHIRIRRIPTHFSISGELGRCGAAGLCRPWFDTQPDPPWPDCPDTGLQTVLGCDGGWRASERDRVPPDAVGHRLSG